MAAHSRSETTGDERDIADDLGLLRKFEGFISRRLDEVPSIKTLLEQQPDDTYERLRSRFVSAIHSLDVHEAALLLDVFALSPETENLARLQQRRAVHGGRIHRGVETVAAREGAALKHLLSRLLTGTYAQSPFVIHVPEMHDGIIYQFTDTLLVIEDRQWRATYESYRFAATFEEMDYLTVTRSYPGRTSVGPEEAFRVETREVAGAGWNDEFWHLNDDRTGTEPMRRGGIYDLKFSIHPTDGDEKKALTLASRAFHERSLSATIRVRFIGEKPVDIWTFRQVSPYARPTAADDDNRTTLDDRGIATVRQRDAHGGLFTGIAWEWRP